MKTLKELAQESLDVQDACNLTGVAHSFSRVVKDLRELCPNEGTRFFNTHPIVKLWVDKLADLSGMRDFHLTAQAYKDVYALLKED